MLTRSPILRTKLIPEARFGDNNWEKGEAHAKTFYVKKLVWEMEGSLSVKLYDHITKSESRQNFAEILPLSQKYSKINPAKLYKKTF